MQTVCAEIVSYSAEMEKYRVDLHNPCTEKEGDRTEMVAHLT